ncbi:MAG: HdrB C-terminal domain-containing protein [Wolinella sp.]
MKRVLLVGGGYGRNPSMGGLLESSRTLLHFLGIEIAGEQIIRGGYWGRFSERFLEKWLEIFLKSEQENAKIMAMEEDSYLDCLYAFRLLSDDSSLIQKFTLKRGIATLLPQKPLYLPDYALQHGDLKGKYQSSFTQFSAAWIGSARAKESPSSMQGFYKELGSALNLKLLFGQFSFESYAHTFAFNPQNALKQSARIYFNAVDLGVDFIMTSSAEQLGFLDSKSKEILKASKRERIETPLLYPTQLILLALGQRDRKLLGIHKHKIKATMI